MATVEQIITDARNYASQTFNDAQSYLAQAVSAAQGMAQISSLGLPGVDTDFDPLKPGDPPTLTDTYVEPINHAVAPTFETLYIPDLPTFPDAPAALNTSNLFKTPKPVYDISPFAEHAPVIKTDWVYPSAPTLVFPDVPVMREISIGQVPDVVLPTFTDEFDGVAPTVPDAVGTLRLEYERMLPVFQDFIKNGVEDWISTYDPAYKANLAKLQARLNRDIDGGYALSDPAEQALFDRQRQRIDAETNAQREQSLQQMAKMGYQLPQGAISAVMDQIAQAGADRNAVAATEVAIERAKIELQHIQFVMNLMANLANALQGVAIQYAGILGQTNSQALEYAKAIAGTLLEMFRAALDLYQAKIEWFRAAAAVYETRLKAALAAFDKHRLELEQAKLTNDINAQDVALYEAQLRGQSTRIQAYVAQLEAIQQMAATEKLKIDLFGEQVRAYGALVGAKESEFNCYKAAISGDAALVDAYATTVNAYRAGVDASASKAQVGIAHSEAIASHNKNLIAQYEAELETYKTEISAESARFDGSVRRNAARLDAYRAKLNALVESKKLEFEQADLNLRRTLAKFNGDLEIAKTNAGLIMKGVEIVAGTAADAAKTSGAIASAAVSSVNTLAKLDEST